MAALTYLSIIVVFKNEEHAHARDYDRAEVFNGFRGINTLSLTPFEIDKYKAIKGDHFPIQAALFINPETAEVSRNDCAKFRQDIGFGFAAIVALSEIVKEN